MVLEGAQEFLFQTPESWANIVLFVPAALVLALRWRAWQACVGLTVVSAAIEMTQSLMGTHSCTGADLAANSLGALLGALTATAIKTAYTRWQRATSSDQDESSTRGQARPGRPRAD